MEDIKNTIEQFGHDINNLSGGWSDIVDILKEYNIKYSKVLIYSHGEYSKIVINGVVVKFMNVIGLKNYLYKVGNDILKEKIKRIKEYDKI